MRQWLAGSSRDHRTLRAAASLAGLLSIPVTVVAGDPAVWQITVVVLVSTAWYVGPNFTAGTTLLAITLVWIAAVDSVLSAWTVALMWLLLVVHTATAASAVLPRETNMSRRLWLRWLGQTGVAGAAGSVLWVLAWVLVRQDLPGYVVVTFLGMAAIGALALLLRTRSLRGDDPVPGQGA